MCLCPKVIYNRVNHFDPVQHPLMMQVPCGKCDECAQLQHNSWFVRCWAEYMSSETAQTYFYTLTYNNENLPTHFGLPCFDKRDVVLFIKRLKKALSPVVRVKYLVSSEFGEKYGRPHYHVLFFLDKSYNPFLFYKLVERCWHLGFVKYGDHAGIVSGLAGIQYVTKYVTKDFMYTDKFNERFCRKAFLYVSELFRRYCTLYHKTKELELVPYLQGDALRWKRVFSRYDRSVRCCVLRTSYYLSEEEKDFVMRFTRVFRRYKLRYLPFHTQSTYLGAAWAQNNLGVEDIPIVLPNGFCQHFSLPRYYRRMFWYDCVENENDGKKTRFVLNDEGIEHCLSKLPQDFSLYRESCQSMILSERRFDDDDVREINRHLGMMAFDDHRALRFFLDNFDLDLDVLAIYHGVFRGRVCTRPFEDFVLSDKMVLENYLDFVKVCLMDSSNYDYGRIYEEDVRLKFKAFLFNNHPFFRPYEEACCLFDALRLIDGRQRYLSKRSQEKLRRKTKDALAPF